MKISSKVRNGLAAMIYIAKYSKNNNTNISLLSISNSLDISKIYLEQAFLLLKRENLVISTKGPKGGYTLSKKPSEISVYEILSALDSSLFEKTEKTIFTDEKSIENAMQKIVFSTVDDSLKSKLSSISLETLLVHIESEENEDYMYYL